LAFAPADKDPIKQGLHHPSKPADHTAFDHHQHDNNRQNPHVASQISAPEPQEQCALFYVFGG